MVGVINLPGHFDTTFLVEPIGHLSRLRSAADKGTLGTYVFSSMEGSRLFSSRSCLNTVSIPFSSHERWRNSEEAFIEAKSSHTAPAPSNAKAASKPKVKKAPPMKGSVLTGQIRNRKGAVSVWDEPASLFDQKRIRNCNQSSDQRSRARRHSTTQ